MNEDSQALPVSTVLIIGSGLIGASIGLGLRQCGVNVHFEDVDPAALSLARERVAGARPTGDSLGELDGDPDVVFVAVPPGASASVISSALRQYLDATISDVCSTKTQLQHEVEISGADLTRYVPGHPMAGREVSGPGAASADLFEGRVWALTPSAKTEARRTTQMASLVQQLGALVVITTPQAHDQAVALTSHTPQIVASMVAAGLESLGDSDVLLSGQGLRDVTRLAASDPDMWTEILASNAEPVASALDGLIGRLGEMRDGLRAGSLGESAVRASLVAGVSGHRRVPGKHGAVAVSYSVVPVVVADRPGELGRLFADVALTGVNLEDVRIEHALGRPTGLVELDVDPRSSETLVAGLRDAGWEVRQ